MTLVVSRGSQWAPGVGGGGGGYVGPVLIVAFQGPVSISTTDCPTEQRTIVPCCLSIAEWSVGWSVVLIQTGPSSGIVPVPESVAVTPL